MCSTCLSDSISGCNGHPGKTPLNNYYLINPAFQTHLNNVLKLFCGYCKCLKNPKLNEIAEEYENEYIKNNYIENKKCFILKKEFTVLINEKSMKCLNKNCQQTSTLRINRDYTIKLVKQVKNEKGKRDDSEHTITIFNILNDAYKPFVKLLTNAKTLDVSLTNLLYHKSLYILSHYVRANNVYKDTVQNAITSCYNSIVNLCSLPYSPTNLYKLQVAIGNLDNSKNINAYKKTPLIVTLADQVSGTNRDGYLTNYILGRRVDETARVVLGPDTENGVGVILVPKKIAEVLSTVIYYNKVTRSYINDIIINPSKYQFKLKKIITKNDNFYKPYDINHVRENRKMNLIHYIKDGDYIEIEKMEGTPIIFNRQPSLYATNLQAGKMILTDGGTIKLPITIEPSMNADNDGDEINTFNAKCPAANLEQILIMNSKILAKNVSTGAFSYGLVQDQIIVISNLYQMKNISLTDTYNLLGIYVPYIKDMDKETYTGREILSLFIKDGITIPGYIKNGMLDMTSLNFKYTGPMSNQSIFYVYSSVTDTHAAISLLNSYQYIAQRYMYVFGYSIRFDHILPLDGKFSDKNKFIKSKVSEINNKIREAIDDAREGKIIHFSFSNFEQIKKQNIDILNNILLGIVKNEKGPETLMQMSESGYKRTNDDIIKLEYTMGQQGSFHRPGVYSRINSYFVPGDMSIEASGFIVNGLNMGLNYCEHAMNITYSARPKMITTSCGTSDAGVLGKKILKIGADAHVSEELAICNYDTILMPAANFLKISGSDIYFVKLIYPNLENQDDNQWDQRIIYIFNQIKKYLVYNKNSQVITEIIFYINIDGFIETFLNKNPDLPTINPQAGFKLLQEFYTERILPHYINHVDTMFVEYILLTYLNPKRIHLSRELMEYIFDLINYKLRYSLMVGSAIGLNHTTNIQETITQQSLSSFHPVTKTGAVISKTKTSTVKEILSLAFKNKPDVIQCKSKDYNTLLKYKNVFEFANLNQFIPEYEVLTEASLENAGNHKVLIKVRRLALLLKNIKIKQFLQLFDTVLKKTIVVESYWIDIDLDDTYVKILIGVTLHNPKNDFKLAMEYLRFSLLANVTKGNPLNSDIKITKTIIYENLEPKDAYEINFYVDNVRDLYLVDTSDVIIDLGIWNTYYSLGVFHSKLCVINRMLDYVGNLKLYNSCFFLITYMYQGKIPVSIYKLTDKKRVVKKVVHGDPNAFVSAAFNNITDPCQDIYSNMMLGEPIKLGTGFYEMFLNVNNYDSLEYTEEIEKIEDVEIISRNFF
jgi:DNA-directed RNA polymerase beta' subunit